MQKKRLTVADIARLSGVSMMTVSRVINEQSGVSEETRQRIRKIVEDTEFRPSKIARGLATRRSATVGLVMPDVSNPFFSQIARGAEDSAYEQNYSLFLINTAESIEREKSALNTLWQQEIDGAILCSPRLKNNDLLSIIEGFHALILVNRELEIPRPGVATINVDDQNGAMQAVSQLIAFGRRHIAYLAGPKTSISNQRRMAGYLKALKNAGIQPDEKLIEYCNPQLTGNSDSALNVLKRCEKVDAFFCFNDNVAIGAIQTCLENGRDIPSEIAIIGADDIPMASLVMPKLSTLHVDPNWIGCQAMTMLVKLINDPNQILEPVLIQPQLILRQSTP